MARNKMTTSTRLDIVRTATKMFLDKGYSATSSREVSRDLKISPGNLTYYFPTKGDMLAILIRMLADFQWETVCRTVNDGETPITALCFELTAMAAMCEENEVARNLYLSAYTEPKTLAIIRRGDAARAREVFREFCADWTEERFAETEIIVSGIEYATMMTLPDGPPLETRIEGAMDAILRLYHVPRERRRMKIERALSLDYRTYGGELFDKFKQYVAEISETRFSEWLDAPEPPEGEFIYIDQHNQGSLYTSYTYMEERKCGGQV